MPPVVMFKPFRLYHTSLILVLSFTNDLRIPANISQNSFLYEFYRMQETPPELAYPFVTFYKHVAPPEHYSGNEGPKITFKTLVGVSYAGGGGCFYQQTEVVFP